MGPPAHRFPPCTPVAMDDLEMVEEAERSLRANSCRRVRVRKHGSLGRIEVERTLRARLLDEADVGVATLEGPGFHHVTVDLRGCRLGSMNSPLE